MNNLNTSMFNGKNILITGGTGSLGQALTNRLLKTEVNQIRIFSRNELKQIENFICRSFIFICINNWKGFLYSSS